MSVLIAFTVKKKHKPEPNRNLKKTNRNRTVSSEPRVTDISVNRGSCTFYIYKDFMEFNKKIKCSQPVKYCTSSFNLVPRFPGCASVLNSFKNDPLLVVFAFSFNC